MNKWKINSLFWIALFWTSCTKIDVPEPVDDVPVFSLSFSANGQSLALAAGEEQYIMQTGFEKDGNNIHTFTGEFAQENCTSGCGPHLRFEIRDYQAVSSGIVDINGAILPGTYAYKNSTVTNELEYQLDLSATPSPPPTPVMSYSYLWEVADTFLSTPNLEFTFDTLVPVNACLTISNPVDDCQSTFCRDILWDSNPPLTCNFGAAPLQQQLRLQASASGGEGTYTYAWDDGTLTATRWISQDSFINTYCVTVTDGIGTQSSMCKTVNYQPSGAGGTVSDTCSALFIATATIDSIPVNDPFQFSTVAIEYTSTDGTVYRSDLSGQSQQSGFIITKVEPFDRNANDEATLKLTVQFVCTVYEVSGPGQVALNGSGVIAIAYPD